MYELLCAKPHEPIGPPMTVAEWDTYAAGYRTALVMALKAMAAADTRHKLYLAARRLSARLTRRREA